MRAHQARKWFWVAIGLTILSGSLLLVTLLWHDWAEQVFGIDPDAGSGAFEAAVTVASAAAALIFAAWAGLEHRRIATLTQPKPQ